MHALTRRHVLLGSAAALVGCGPTPRPRSPSPSTFHVVDLMDEYWAFWDEARPLALPAQRALFRERLVARHPDVYAPNVLRLPPDNPGALDARIDAWLPRLPAIEADMRRIHRTFLDRLAASTKAFRAALPDFAWKGNVYLLASVDSFNGAGREVGGAGALLFGLDVIARSQPNAKIAVLMHHELFHFYQAVGRNVVADALWVEGLATYASIALNAGTTDDDALPVSHLHDQADPQLDVPVRRVLLGSEMPTHARVLGPLLLADLESEEPPVYADFFLGRAGARIHGRPVRSGYWFGLQLVRRIARGRTLPELARLDPLGLLPEMKRALAAMLA